jgi:hypothetical protein
MRKSMEEKIAQAHEVRQQAENQLKKLMQEKKEADKKARTRRLIERGAIAESLIENASELTNEQFKDTLSNALKNYLARSKNNTVKTANEAG